MKGDKQRFIEHAVLDGSLPVRSTADEVLHSPARSARAAREVRQWLDLRWSDVGERERFRRILAAFLGACAEEGFAPERAASLLPVATDQVLCRWRGR